MEMRDEYGLSPEDLRNGIRGHFAERFKDGVNIVPLDPDSTGISPDAQPTVAEQSAREGNALASLEKLIGTVEAPTDWAAEHDHYLYGTPKRKAQEP